MGNNRTYRIIAIAVTVLLHVVILLIMFWSRLTFVKPEEPQPPQKTDISFGGEYVELGDIPLPDRNGDPAQSTAAEKATPPADDNADAGKQGEGSSLVSTNAESAMKTPKKHNGPTKEELEEQARAKREREKQESESRKISSNVKNAFGKAGGKGKSGSPDGNASQGALAGQPGHTLGVGYTLSSWGKPSSGFDGEIYIKVRVNSQGKVIDASYLKGTGAAAANEKVRRSCVQASLRSRFSVPKNATGEKVGTIIWRFE